MPEDRIVFPIFVMRNSWKWVTCEPKIVIVTKAEQLRLHPTVIFQPVSRDTEIETNWVSEIVIVAPKNGLAVGFDQTLCSAWMRFQRLPKLRPKHNMFIQGRSDRHQTFDFAHPFLFLFLRSQSFQKAYQRNNGSLAVSYDIDDLEVLQPAVQILHCYREPAEHVSTVILIFCDDLH